MSGSGGFEHKLSFQVTVGEPVSTAPLGPDRYGYYGYDDTDAGYSEQPQFNWFEIDPSQGGGGSYLNIPNDRAVAIDLPFTFRFYGRDYRTISVSDNGYIAMGNTSFGDPYNWHIPSAHGPDDFIAVFWDDFRADTLGAPGVFYYYDEGGHRLIVEWSRAYHIHGFRPPQIAEQQTFQAILYDPACHPTKTGDGPILLQYLSVQNDDSLWGNSHNYATVGVQSPDHNDGLEWTYGGSYPVPAAVIVPNRAIKFTTNPSDTFFFLTEPKNNLSSTPRSLIVEPTIVRKRCGFKVSGRGKGMVKVFDVMGREIKEFKVLSYGESRWWWELTDKNGKQVPAGIYLVEFAINTGSNKISGEKELLC